jgi:hypothetical protein
MNPDDRQREWSRLREQKGYAGCLAFVGGALFIANLLGVEEPTNNTLGGLTLIMLIAGCVWLWHLHQDMRRIVRRDLDRENVLRTKEGGKVLPP